MDEGINKPTFLKGGFIAYKNKIYTMKIGCPAIESNPVLEG